MLTVMATNKEDGGLLLGITIRTTRKNSTETENESSAVKEPALPLELGSFLYHELQQPFGRHCLISVFAHKSEFLEITVGTYWLK